MVMPPRVVVGTETGRAGYVTVYNATLYSNASGEYSLALYWGNACGVRRTGVRAMSSGGAGAASSPGRSRTLAVMSATTAELPSDWWTTEDVLAFLRSAGAPISRATWAAYVSRGQAPAPDRKSVV